MFGMANQNNVLAEIHRMDDEIKTIIGRKAFGYVSEPTATTRRITFADGTVCLTMAEAHDYMTGLLATAKDDPGKLPWPLSEPLTA